MASMPLLTSPPPPPPPSSFHHGSMATPSAFLAQNSDFLAASDLSPASHSLDGDDTGCLDLLSGVMASSGVLFDLPSTEVVGDSVSTVSTSAPALPSPTKANVGLSHMGQVTQMVSLGGAGIMAQGPPAVDGSSQSFKSTAVQESNNLAALAKLLMRAAMSGNVEEVRQLIARGAPFSTNELGDSPLHVAAEHGHAPVCERLLAAGISKDARTKMEKTPLHVAATEGRMEVMEVLLKSRCNVDAEDMLHMTPLHWAVERGHIPAMELLLRYGASVDVVSKFDKTPMEIASDNGRPDVFEVLQNPEPYRQVAPEYSVPNVSDPVTLAATNSIAVGGDNNELLDADLLSHTMGSPTKQASDAMRLLESHGITFLNDDSGSDVANNLGDLVRSGGQKLALTEAGKLALASKQQPQQMLQRQQVSHVIRGGGGVVKGSRPSTVMLAKKPMVTGPTKVISSVDKFGVKKVVTLTPGGQRKPASGITTANVVAGLTGLAGSTVVTPGVGGGKRVTVTPAQLARLKQLQKTGRMIIIGGNNQTGSPAAVASSDAVRKTISIGGRQVTAVPAGAASAGSVTQATMPGSGSRPVKTNTIRIVRVNESTGNQTVSNVVVPASVSTGSPTIKVIPSSGPPATTKFVPAKTAAVVKVAGASPTKSAGGGGGDDALREEFERMKRELQETRQKMEERERANRQKELELEERERANREKELELERMKRLQEAEAGGGGKQMSSVSSEDVD